MSLIKLEPKDFMSEVPSFPDFPYSEYQNRINRVRELMGESDIDVLLLWDREDVRYFFGYQTTHWELPPPHPAVGIISLHRDPIIVPGQITLYNAQAFCWTRDIRYLPSAHEMWQQRALPIDIADIVKEIGCENKNIALEMGATHQGTLWIPRPLNDIEAMKNELPNAKFVDGDKVIWECRMIKSPLEVDRIRQAASVIRRCHAAVVDRFEPGMTEMDVGKIIHHVEVDSGDLRGGDYTLCAHIVCNREKEGVCDCLALDDVTITKDDYLQLDLQHKHKGYWADIARTYQVGPISDETKRGYELCSKGLRDAEAILEPGVKMSALYKAITKPMVDAGVPTFEMGGHGIGMKVHEPPENDAVTDEPLREGVVIAMEAWAFGNFRRDGGIGVIGTENQYACTDKGYEKISGLDESIIQVAHPF